MAKMYALRKILRHDKNGVEEIVEPRAVFDATPTEAKQLDALNAARPARKEEVEAYDASKAKSDGAYFTGADNGNGEIVKPMRPTGSGAEGDPNNAPKSK